MKFTIDRKRWLVGERGIKSMLYRPDDGKMCCLGFYCLAKGATTIEMAEKTNPIKLENCGERFPETVIPEDGGLHGRDTHKCTIYDIRPAVCRIFGASEHKRLSCPHGRKPEQPMTAEATNRLMDEVERLGY